MSNFSKIIFTLFLYKIFELTLLLFSDTLGFKPEYKILEEKRNYFPLKKTK